MMIIIIILIILMIIKIMIMKIILMMMIIIRIDQINKYKIKCLGRSYLKTSKNRGCKNIPPPPISISTIIIFTFWINYWCFSTMNSKLSGIQIVDLLLILKILVMIIILILVSIIIFTSRSIKDKKKDV